MATRTRLPKKVKTIDDLLIHDNLKVFLDHFVKRELPTTDAMIIVSAGDKGPRVGVCGFVGTFEVLGALEAAKHIVFAGNTDDV